MERSYIPLVFYGLTGKFFVKYSVSVNRTLLSAAAILWWFAWMRDYEKGVREAKGEGEREMKAAEQGPSPCG